MILEDIFINVTNKLSQTNIPYMIVGGVATITYGKPRTTHDIDLVVEIYGKNIPELIGVFEGEYYISEEGIKDAILHKTMFNVIHHESGIKIDFWILHRSDYDLESFKRRRKIKIFEKEVYITSPEDSIIKKLLWYKESDIDKHLDDALGVLEIQYNNMDFSYIEKWAQELNVEQGWKEIKEEAQKFK